MSERETLVVALVVVYLLECVCWARRDAVLFRALIGRHFHLADPPEFLVNHRGNLHWLNPLPPFGSIYLARAFPLSVSAQGVLAYTADCLDPRGRPPHTGTFLRHEAMESVVAVEKKLLVNGAPLWASDSVHQPAALATWLRELKPLSAPRREEHIRARLRERFDLAAAQALRTDLAARLGLIQRLAIALFFFFFGVCPYTVWRFGWFPALWFLLPGLLALTGAITLRFVRTHRHFYPAASDDRFKLGGLTLLAPAVTIRAADLLTKPLWERFHPVTAAAGLLPREEFARFARHCWRDLRYPLLPLPVFPDAAAQETEQWFRAEQLLALETFLAEQKIPARELAIPLPPTDPSHTLHCPRCEAQFTAKATICADCGDRPLQPLTTA